MVWMPPGTHATIGLEVRRRAGPDDPREEEQPGRDLEEEDDRDDGVREAREEVVPGHGDRRPPQEDVVLAHLPHAAELRPIVRDDRPPVRVLVAHEAPVEAERDGDREDDGRELVDEPHGRHPRGRLDRRGRDDEGPVDVRPGDREDHDADDDRPVGEPDGELPDVDGVRADPPVDLLLVLEVAELLVGGVARRRGRERPLPGHSNGACHQSTSTFTFSSPFASTTWTAHARHGSNEWMVRRISTGWSGTPTGVPMSEASYGPVWP